MGISILVVDDSKFMRRVIIKNLQTMFKDLELTITEAVDGNQALEYLCTTQYDLVFLDLTMPEKTGYEVLEELKEKGIKSKIIVLTADIQPDAEKVVKEFGAIGYLKKERKLNVDHLAVILEEIGVLS